MATKDLIARGVGFAPGSTKFMPTLGLGIAPVIPPVNVTIPVITGSAIVGQTLQGSNGTWLNGPTSFTYQWYRDGVLIPGAITASYTAVLADLDHALTIAVTASNSAGSATATSLPTALVQASATRYMNEGGAGPRRRRLPTKERENEEALALLLILELAEV